MKIIKLKSENIKKIKAVDISPDGNIVKISGKNGQGKSSVLDSILYALAGKKSIPEMPIRDGEEKAKIELDLGDIKIERSFTKTGSYLKVLTKEGAMLPKAQEKLSQLVSGVSFDPYEFAELGDKEQTEMLTEVLGIGEELSALDGIYQKQYEDRTTLNRDLKNAEAQIPLEKPTEEEREVKPVDVVKISKQLESEREKYTAYSTAYQAVIDAKNKVNELEASLAKAKESEALAQKALDALNGYNENTGVELKKQLENAETINATVAKVATYDDAVANRDNKKQLADHAEKNIQITIDKRAMVVAEAKSPIEGLDIIEGKVHYNKIPFAQLSGGEKIKVSMSIAMAMNPELRVIRILDASLLDEDNMKVIEEMAGEKDYQVWLEVVDGSGDVGFFIEDGEIIQ